MNLTPAKVTTLMLAAVAGLIGIYVVKGLFGVEKRVERPRIVNIPLAAANLAPGTKITREHIGMGPYPERELKEDMLRSQRVIIGRVVKEAIKAGSPMRGTQLYEPGENLPLEVADGKQAIAVPVKSSAEMVDGLIKPGDFVDVHFTLDSQSNAGIDPRIGRLGGVSMTMFKGVKMLAFNRNFRQGPVLVSGNSVTLELAPEQTNILLVAQPRGTISLTYNPTGEGDGGVALNNADRATLWEVLGLKKPAPRNPGPELEKPFVTETYKGTQGGDVLWGKDGKKYSAVAGLGGSAGGGRVYASDAAHDVPAGSGAGTDAGGTTGPAYDAFDPSDVFGGPSSGVSDRVPNVEAPADPDIPSPAPGSAARGVRSRTGSILRVRPDSVGPTALRP